MATTNAAAMLAKSDSEDSDFDPKAVAPSEMDSVAAEAFHEQDAVPEHECSDVERPGFDEDYAPTEQVEKKDAVPNGVSIAKEKDSDESKEPKKDQGEKVKANGIMDEAKEATTKDTPEDSTTVEAEKAIDSKTLENEKAVDAPTEKDGAKVEVEKGAENNAVEKVVTAVAVAEGKEANIEAVGVKSSNTEAKDAPVDDEATKELSAVAKAAVAAVEAKTKALGTKNEPVDELWKAMNQPVAKSTPRKRPASANAGLDAWLTAEPSVPVKSSTGLPRLDDATEASDKITAKVTEEEATKRRLESEAGRAKKRQKVGTGLESVLAAAKNQDNAGPTTMDRTKNDWKEFKKTDKEIEDELEAHKKDKDRYTDKKEFLARSNLREWEVEQAGKKGRPPPNSSRNA